MPLTKESGSWIAAEPSVTGPRRKRWKSVALPLALACAVGCIIFLVVLPLIPGGVRAGRWRVWAFFGRDGTLAPIPPPFFVSAQHVYEAPQPTPEAIGELGPQLSWMEGGEFRVELFRWQYWIRIELPRSDHQLAPPLP